MVKGDSRLLSWKLGNPVLWDQKLNADNFVKTIFNQQLFPISCRLRFITPGLLKIKVRFHGHRLPLLLTFMLKPQLNGH